MSAALPMRLLLPLTTTSPTSTTTTTNPFCVQQNGKLLLGIWDEPVLYQLIFTNYLLPGAVFLCTGLVALWIYEKRSRQDSWRYEEENAVSMFGSDEDASPQIPTKIQSVVEGSGAVIVSEYKSVPDVDYLQKTHIYTSGASRTNAAVIRGALRAEKPELLTVILPQSLKKQPAESQEL